MQTTYAILKNVTIKTPVANVKAKPNGMIHEICVYEQMLKDGVHLPFLPEVRELLSGLGLAPS